MSQYGANNLANKGFNARQILNYFYKDVSLSKLKLIEKTEENKKEQTDEKQLNQEK